MSGSKFKIDTHDMCAMQSNHSNAVQNRKKNLEKS